MSKLQLIYLSACCAFSLMSCHQLRGVCSWLAARRDDLCHRDGTTALVYLVQTVQRAALHEVATRLYWRGIARRAT
jgi:hypothetical protein